MIRSITAFVALFGTWLLLSGIYTPMLMTFGAVSSLIVVLLMRRMDSVDGAAENYTLGVRPLFYVPWLAWEIVKANLQVAKVVLTPGLPIQEHLLRVPSDQKTEVGQVVYGNSITLTPGTITLDCRDGTFLVHALTDEAADGLRSGDMNRKCAALEGGE